MLPTAHICLEFFQYFPMCKQKDPRKDLLDAMTY